MLVVLDSSEICSDFMLRSNAFKLLLNEGKNGRVRIVVPKVVLMETLNKYQERAKQALDLHEKGMEALATLKVPIGQRPQVATLAQARAAYEKFLEESLVEANAAIAEFPKVAHESLVTRILARRKPSAAKDEGYRDALIWESVLELAQTEEEALAFVSRNTRDFADNAKEKLAEELVEELKTRGIDPARIKFYENLKQFTGEAVAPAQVQLIELEKLFHEDHEFGDALADSLWELARGAEVHMSWADAQQFDDPSLVSFDRFRFEFKDARQLSDDVVLAEIQLSGEAILHAGVRYVDLHTGRIKDELTIVDEDHWAGFEPELVQVQFLRPVLASFEASWIPTDRRFAEVRLVQIRASGLMNMAPPQRETLF